MLLSFNFNINKSKSLCLTDLSDFSLREAVVAAGLKRVRPAMMTTAVAVIALLPVLSSSGKGADIMVPMAIPTFGGMIIQVMTVYVVPLFQSMWRESAVRNANRKAIKAFQNQRQDENI
jgi:Cu(I)/Ag(I) efflux system membrane protein CusA/SilA